MHPATVHGVGVITKLHFAIFAKKGVVTAVRWGGLSCSDNAGVNGYYILQQKPRMKVKNLLS